MYGHEGVARDLKRRVEERLAVRLGVLRAERGVDTVELPDPVQVLPYFLPDIDVDSYPTICITEIDTPSGLTGARALRQGMEYDAYVYRYPFRIYAYLLTETYGGAELQLKRYLTGIREVLLENRILTDTDAAYVVIDPETLSENFESPLEDEAQQVLAAGFVGVVLESTEIINRTDRNPGLVVGVRGGVTAMDRHTGQPTGAPSTIPEGGTA